MTKVLYFILIVLLAASVFADYDDDDEGEESSRFKRQLVRRNQKAKKASSSSQNICNIPNLIGLIRCVGYKFVTVKEAQEQKCYKIRKSASSKEIERNNTLLASCLWPRFANPSAINDSLVPNSNVPFIIDRNDEGIITNMYIDKLTEFLKNKNSESLPIETTVKACENVYLRSINSTILRGNKSGKKVTIDMKFFLLLNCVSCTLDQTAPLTALSGCSNDDEKLKAARENLGKCLDILYTLPLTTKGTRKAVRKAEASSTPSA